MEEHRGKIRLFPEVKEVLEGLSQDYDLIILSNAAREFVEIETREAKIDRYYTRVFSTTADFREVKKTALLYRQICDIMGVKPFETVHIGDLYEFDYLVPKGAGIESYYLDRDGNGPKDEFTVRDLKEFARLIERSKAPIESD